MRAWEALANFILSLRKKKKPHGSIFFAGKRSTQFKNKPIKNARSRLKERRKNTNGNFPVFNSRKKKILNQEFTTKHFHR